METVLAAPAASETQTDASPTRQIFKRTRAKKKSILSSNGNHPSKVFMSPTVKIDMKSDAYEYEGWRYIEKPLANGQVKHERVPLTAYELLHPEEGYTIVHKTPHDLNTEQIATSTKTHLINVPNVRVFGDLRTDFNLPGVVPVSPDISVVFGVSEERIWSTFNCQEEGVYPSVIFEVTSPGTRAHDFDEKYDYYCRAGQWSV